MKKFLFIIFTLFVSTYLSAQSINMNPLRWFASSKSAETLMMYSRGKSGTDTTYSSLQDSAIIKPGGYVWSQIVPVHGNLSMSFQTNTVANTSYMIEIWGTIRKSGEGYDSIADSTFERMGFITSSGNGVDSTYFQGAQDSITAKRNSIPTLIPIVGMDAVKFKFLAGGDATVNLTLRSEILRYKD